MIVGLTLPPVASGPPERSRHPHLPEVRRTGADQGREPRSAAAVHHLGRPRLPHGLRQRLVLRRRLSSDRRRDDHPHCHAGAREFVAVQRVSERRAESDHRVGAGVAADGVAGGVAQRVCEPLRTTVGAFTVVNLYPVPVTYSAEQESRTFGSLKVNGNLRLPGDWETRVSSIYLAPDLFPQAALAVATRWMLACGRA